MSKVMHIYGITLISRNKLFYFFKFSNKIFNESLDTRLKISIILQRMNVVLNKIKYESPRNTYQSFREQVVLELNIPLKLNLRFGKCST